MPDYPAGELSKPRFLMRHLILIPWRPGLRSGRKVLKSHLKKRNHKTPLKTIAVGLFPPKEKNRTCLSAFERSIAHSRHVRVLFLCGCPPPTYICCLSLKIWMVIKITLLGSFALSLFFFPIYFIIFISKVRQSSVSPHALWGFVKRFFFYWCFILGLFNTLVELFIRFEYHLKIVLEDFDCNI